MSAASRVTLQRQQSLHLYRGLLRQCTYLPDALTRQEIKRQVVGRFRQHKLADHDATKKVKPTKQSIQSKEDELRTWKRLRAGQQHLRTLEKANEGSPVSLRLVFRHAYGRTGKRRHELLEPLLTPVPPAQAAIATKPNSKGNPWDITTVSIPDIFMPVKKESKGVIEYHIAPKYECLKAIIASQTKNHAQLDSRQRIKEHIPSTPLANRWLRSMPRKRVKNLAVRHYAYLIERLFPPLPVAEWERLQRIASGAQPCDIVSGRRAPGSIRYDKQLRQPDLEALVKHSVEEAAAAAARTSSDVTSQSEHGADASSAPSAPALCPHPVSTARTNVLEAEIKLRPRSVLTRNLHNHPHALTQRYVRRLLCQIFKECPRLHFDGESRAYSVEWGMKQVEQAAVAAQAPKIASFLERLSRPRPKEKETVPNSETQPELKSEPV